MPVSAITSHAASTAPSQESNLLSPPRSYVATGSGVPTLTPMHARNPLIAPRSHVISSSIDTPGYMRVGLSVSKRQIIGWRHPDQRQGNNIRVAFEHIELGIIGYLIRKDDATFAAARLFRETVGNFQVKRYNICYVLICFIVTC